MMKMTRKPVRRSRGAPESEFEEAFRPIDFGAVEQIALDDIHCFPGNPRTHDERNEHMLARIIAGTRIFVPIVIDADNRILAGEARWGAARILKMPVLPAIRAHGLSEAEMQAFRLADNKAVELGRWDDRLLPISLKSLADLKPNFSLEVTGFTLAEIDIKLDSLKIPVVDDAAGPDPADSVPEREPVPISRPDDIWICGDHRVMCGSCLDEQAIQRLMNGQLAHMVFQDAPYNVSVTKHVSGLGKTKHKEFAMASGEMTRPAFTAFLQEELQANSMFCKPGATMMCFMDWRSIELLICAGREIGLELINLCVWVKSNGSMGSLYRSKHELICIFRKPGAPSTNNVQLGKFGRYRTNVWTAPGANSFGKNRMEELGAHPTPKNVALIADAIRDVSNAGEIVLDSFLGSGTTMIAAERTGRAAYGMEIDPGYVDVAVRRWEQFTGRKALLEGSGRSFEEVAAERTA